MRDIIIDGGPGYVHRVKGWRLPSVLVPYLGKPYSDIPTDLLERYYRWFCGPKRWLGHSFELYSIEDELARRCDDEKETT